MKIPLFAQQIEKQLDHTQQKLDKLIDGFLEGIIDKATYLHKKDKFIQKKMNLEQRQNNVGQKGHPWLEPMRNWLKQLREHQTYLLRMTFML